MIIKSRSPLAGSRKEESVSCLTVFLWSAPAVTPLTKRELGFQVLCECSQNGVSMRHSVVAQHPQPAATHRQLGFLLILLSLYTKV